MKLRLEKDSVRVRLSPTEIDTLNSNKSINEKIVISGSNTFAYCVNVIEGLSLCALSFGRQSLSIDIPKHTLERWMNSNQVGIRETINTETGTLILVVEEDLRPGKRKDVVENHATER